MYNCLFHFQSLLISSLSCVVTVHWGGIPCGTCNLLCQFAFMSVERWKELTRKPFAVKSFIKKDQVTFPTEKLWSQRDFNSWQETLSWTQVWWWTPAIHVAQIQEANGRQKAKGNGSPDELEAVVDTWPCCKLITKEDRKLHNLYPSNLYVSFYGTEKRFCPLTTLYIWTLKSPVQLETFFFSWTVNTKTPTWALNLHI